MKQKEPSLDFFGIGGKHSRKAGCRIIFDSENWGVVGATEILKIIPRLFYVLKQIPQILRMEAPDLAILIDYPGFNLKLSQILHKNKVRVVYYIPPMVFWRKGKKARYVARWCDQVITIFPQEYQKYRAADAPVYFVGHPLLDMVSNNLEKEEILSLLKLDKAKKIVGIFPGSRQQEIKNLLPPMLDAAKILESKIPNLQFVLAATSLSCREEIEKIVADREVKVNIFDNFSPEIMKVSEVLLIASGTATLEATILGTPMIIVYKVSKITEFLAGFVLQKKIIGLPNIIAQKLIVPELLQENVNGVKIADVAQEILISVARRKEISDELGKIKEKLGEKGAIERVAEIILS